MGSIGGLRATEVADMNNFDRHNGSAVQAGFLTAGHPFSYKIRRSEERCSAAQA
jgi:hypothetical protein